MSKVLIKFTDGTEREEYCWEGNVRVKDGLLIISKGRYEHCLHVNMQHVREFQERDQ